MSEIFPFLSNQEAASFLLAADGLFNTQGVRKLAKILHKYDKEEAATLAAGLLLSPELQANCFRLELLVQLIAANCEGKRKPTWSDITHWLNRHLGAVAWAEDPPEDVFVTNIITRSGEYLVLGGLWEVPDSATRLLMECIERYGGDEQLAWLDDVYALLALSDLVLRRAKLSRWRSEHSIPKNPIELIPAMHEGSTRIVVSLEDLETEGIPFDKLENFLFPEARSHEVMGQSNQESLLHERPLLRFGSNIVIALPNAITYAARRFIINCAKEAGQINHLEHVLMNVVIEQADRVLRSGSRHGVERIRLPEDVSGIENLCTNLVYRIGKRRIIHLLIMPDSLEQFSSTGLLDPTDFSEKDLTLVEQQVSSLREYLDSSEEIDYGHSILLLGHLGQAYFASDLPNKAKWTFDVCRIHDLELLLRDSDSPLDKLLLLLAEREREKESGLRLPNTNGLLNLFAYWTEQGYSLRPTEIPHDSSAYLQIGTDFVMGLRRARRLNSDEHCKPHLDGKWMNVVNANSDSIYESVKAIPVFTSITHLKNGILSFCLDQKQTTVWVTFLTGDNPLTNKLAFKLWEGLQILIYRTLKSSDPPMSFPVPVIEIIFDMSKLVGPQEARDNATHGKGLDIRYHRAKPIAKIYAEPGFFRSFSGVGNDGEKELIAHFLLACRTLAGHGEICKTECEAAAAHVLGAEGAKVIHSFESYKPIEYLLSTDKRKTFSRPNEHINSVLRSVFAWKPSRRDKFTLDLNSSREGLNEAVTHLMSRIIKKLSRFDRTSITIELLHAHETLIRDKDRWRSTARAVRGLYGIDEGTNAAEVRERERSQSTLTLRALVEAAICESPTTGGIAPDGYSIDELFGLMCALIELGRDSETIYHGMATDGITIYPNGSYSFDANILGTVGSPYTTENFRVTYSAAAADYENWALPKSPDGPNSNGKAQSPEFLSAFEAEYQISFDHFLDAIAALLDAAVDRNSVVMTISEHEILELLTNRGVSQKEAHAFLSAFALPSRQSWAPKFPSASPKDVEPWSFGRKLSVMLRPIIECGSEESRMFSIGAGTLKESISYILHSIFDGHFDDKTFSSSQMRSYIGFRNELLGNEFTKKVASSLKALGYETKTEVLMTRLGASKSPNLGDIDVLAWAPNGQVLAIECKRLKGARTVAEIALTCDRFRGYANDRLAKHLRRVHWLQEHQDMLSRFTGLSEATIKLRAPLLTSAPVPFRYLQDLPMKKEDVLHLGNIHELAP